MNRKQEQIENLLQFATVLKENGFTVLVPNREEKSGWIKFYKNGFFGCIDCEYFGGYNFGTVHKPCRECGTGFGIVQGAELLASNAEKCLISAPNWATSTQRQAIKPYKDIDDFISSTHNLWAKYSVL